MISRHGLAGQLSALAVLLIIVMGGAVIIPFHSTRTSSGRFGGADVTALQLGNGTSTTSFTFSNSTTSSSTTQPPTTSSVSATSSTTSLHSTRTNTTTSQTTTSNSTSTTFSNSTTTVSFTNSTTTASANSTTTRAYTNSTTSSTNSTSFTTTTTFANSTTSTTANATLVQDVNTKWNPDADFYNFINYGLFNDGGDCYGFSSTAILYFEHYQLGDQTAPYYPQPTSSVASLPGQTGYYTDCYLGSCFKFTTSDTLTQTTFPIYVHERYGQYQLPDGWNDPSNEQAQVQALEQDIQGGMPAILALGPTDGHAVVAWGYQLFSNDSMVIRISDPNYGAVTRFAYVTNGQFSYVGTTSWSKFTVVSPAMLQWSWLSSFISGNYVTETDGYSNQYYTYVFSDVPITIVGGAGYANFTTPGDSLTFSSTISGAVGFEEGGLQAYAIPQGLQYTVLDPGTTSSRLLVVIPQNETSSVGYELDSTSSSPLSLAVSPSSGKLNVTSNNQASLTVALFSVGPSSHSIVNATSISVASSQTAVVSVPNWGGLSSPGSAPSLQVFSPGSTQPVTSVTFTNGQQGLPQSPSLSAYALPAVVVAVIVIAGILVFTYARRKKTAN